MILNKELLQVPFLHLQNWFIGNKLLLSTEITVMIQFLQKNKPPIDKYFTEHSAGELLSEVYLKERWTMA